MQTTPTTTPTGSSPIRLHASWLAHLEAEFQMPYMRDLKSFLSEERKQGHTVFPKAGQIFNALNLTPLESVKVVVLGQDPYHGAGQAHGLSFSVPGGVPFPPSLQNIFKELRADLNVAPPKSGDLTPWAEAGVLLLNATLTVREGNAGSHQNRGWEAFTDKVIRVLNNSRSNLVFILWGTYAQKKGAFIDRARHLVLEAPHPSPLSAHRGFFGSKPFSKTNAYLLRKGLEPIPWTTDPAEATPTTETTPSHSS